LVAAFFDDVWAGNVARDKVNSGKLGKKTEAVRGNGRSAGKLLREKVRESSGKKAGSLLSNRQKAACTILAFIQ
jgi:hypothetical protein